MAKRKKKQIDEQELARIKFMQDRLTSAAGACLAEQKSPISKVAALAYLMFNLFTPPCFAAIGAMNSEMKSKKWLWGGICLQLGVGYTIGFLVYQIGTVAVEGTLGAGFVPGLIAIAVMVAVVLYLIRRTNRNLAAEYALEKRAQA